MLIRADAIVLSNRSHGEHGAIVRALTRDDGVQPGYVRGGRSRALRPVLQPGNRIRGEWRARVETQLPALTAEPVESRAALHADPAGAAMLEWVTALPAAVLPEAQPYPRLYDALAALLDAVVAAPSARGWAPGLARFELLVLAELGFGLDLTRCVATGAEGDLTHVSPRSGGAVSAGAALGYEAKLLPLPPFLRDGGGTGDWGDILAALAITGHFLERDILTARLAGIVLARDRLLDRLRAMVA